MRFHGPEKNPYLDTFHAVFVYISRKQTAFFDEYEQ